MHVLFALFVFSISFWPQWGLPVLQGLLFDSSWRLPHLSMMSRRCCLSIFPLVLGSCFQLVLPCLFSIACWWCRWPPSLMLDSSILVTRPLDYSLDFESYSLQLTQVNILSFSPSILVGLRPYGWNAKVDLPPPTERNVQPSWNVRLFEIVKKGITYDYCHYSIWWGLGWD